MKTKVAILVPSLRGGGAERVMTTLVTNIDNKKFDIKFILVNKEGPYIKLIPKDIEIIDLNSKRARYSIPKLIKEINNFEPDVILSTLGYLNIMLLGVRRLLIGNPKIIVRHSIAPSASLNTLPTVKRSLLLNLYKFFYNKADIVLAQCKDMKNDLISSFKLDPSKVKFIYNPLNLDHIHENMLKYNPFEDNNINLLAAGRLTNQKGFDILLKAFKIVNKKIPETRLTILGKGELDDALQNLAERLQVNDKTNFEGFVNNPYPYYYNSDMYILPSRYEGFPNTLLEAIACKTKVVSTNCKNGPREIIGNNEYGMLIEEENYQDLAVTIIKYLKEPNKTEERAEDFNLKKIINNYEDLLINIKGI